MSPQRLCLLLALVAVSGCSSGLKEFPVAPVEGTVTCNGKPVAHAFVFFEPISSGKSAIVGKAGFAISDEQGRFVLTTYHDRDGAVVAQHRVRVAPPTGEKSKEFKCDCLVDDTVDQMQVEIKSGESHQIEVKLKGKARKLTPREIEDQNDV